MKLSEMSFKESRMAEIKISSIVERIMADKETAELCDALFNGKGLDIDPNMNEAKKAIAKQQYAKKRINATVGLTKRLVLTHFAEVCEIFAILNKKSKEEIENMPRTEANAQLSEMFDDGDLISFFMSSEALAQAAQFAI